MSLAHIYKYITRQLGNSFTGIGKGLQIHNNEQFIWHIIAIIMDNFLLLIPCKCQRMFNMTYNMFEKHMYSWFGLESENKSYIVPKWCLIILVIEGI